MNPLLEQEYLNKIKECEENAKRYYDKAPSVVFIDEFDSIALSRCGDKQI